MTTHYAPPQYLDSVGDEVIVAIEYTYTTEPRWMGVDAEGIVWITQGTHRAAEGLEPRVEATQAEIDHWRKHATAPPVTPTNPSGRARDTRPPRRTSLLPVEPRPAPVTTTHGVSILDALRAHREKHLPPTIADGWDRPEETVCTSLYLV